jgi:hypothetical protein
MKTQTRGVAVVENTVDIARSAEDVFDYCVDLTREPEWNAKAKRVEKLSAGPIGLGTRHEAEFLKGNPTAIECALRAPNRVGIRGSLSPPGCQEPRAGFGDGGGRPPPRANGVETERNAEVTAAHLGSLHAQITRA